ncbi:MAG: hypothetical protein HQL06_04115 [Nitrospirae bacterium]|nr:hypothetical protein [Nitrospirota bacterium]
MKLYRFKARLLLLIVSISMSCLYGAFSSEALAETKHSLRTTHKVQPKISSLIKRYKIDAELQAKQKMSLNDIITSEKLALWDEVEKDFGVLPAISSKIPQYYHQSHFKKTITTYTALPKEQKASTNTKGLMPPYFYAIEAVDGKVFGVKDVIVNDENEHYAKELSQEFSKIYGTPDESEVYSGEQGMERWEQYLFVYKIIYENRYYLFSANFREEPYPKRTLVIISLSNIEQVYSEFEEKAKKDDQEWKLREENRIQKIKETMKKAFPQSQ